MVEAGETRSSVSLVIPCKPEYLALGRLVAGSLGAREGWDEEAITDLKLVVSELSSFFFTPPGPSSPAETLAPAGSSLRLEFDVAPDEWAFTLSNPDHSMRLPSGTFDDPFSERGLSLTIIQALVDSVEQTDDQSAGTVFRVRKHLSPSENLED